VKHLDKEVLTDSRSVSFQNGMRTECRQTTFQRTVTKQAIKRLENVVQIRLSAVNFFATRFAFQSSLQECLKTWPLHHQTFHQQSVSLYTTECTASWLCMRSTTANDLPWTQGKKVIVTLDGIKCLTLNKS